MIAPTQLINVQRGTHEVAIDLSADQAQTLQGNSSLNVSLQTVDVGVLAVCEQQPAGLVGHLEQALPDSRPLRARLQVDRRSRRAGRDPGAGDHPVDVPRRAAAEATRSRQNLAKAKAALAASGAASQTVTLEYPSDLTINGVPFTTLAQKVQANLQAAGFNIKLSGSPTVDTG